MSRPGPSEAHQALTRLGRRQGRGIVQCFCRYPIQALQERLSLHIRQSGIPRGQGFRQFNGDAHSIFIVPPREIVLKENATLTARVAVLEEGRKTIAADVKLAVTETLAQLEIDRLKEELAEAKRQGLPQKIADDATKK